MNSFAWHYHADTAQPASKTALEHRLSRSQIYPVPHPIRQLWHPASCPAHLLPYLAWAFSVDYWDDGWSEEAKREVIAAAYRVHSKKGTIAALREAVRPFGLELTVTEWWQENPRGEAGTFRLTAFSESAAISRKDFNELVRLIDEVKPLSRKMAALIIGTATKGRVSAAAVSLSSAVVTVYPYIAPVIELTPAALSAAAVQQAGIATIKPRI